MLYGRRLDQSLQHVDGSRYALVHAVAKRARQITLWLTADPAELRAESAPPPAPGELTSRDPVALAEAEILDGEVNVRWDPEGRGDDTEFVEIGPVDDPLLIEGIGDDDDLDTDDIGSMTPALAQVLEGAADDEETAAAPAADADDDTTVTRTHIVDGQEIQEISLEDVEEPGDDDDEENDL